tara:strand:- start:827 stop:4603 length:3777 start_codon:yes stop_codon:yes gene_type:complete
MPTAGKKRKKMQKKKREKSGDRDRRGAWGTRFSEGGEEGAGRDHGGGDPNAVEIAPKRAKKKLKRQPRRQLSKKELRKQKQLAARAASRELRAGLYAELAKTQLAPAHLALLKSTSTLGQRQTSKQRAAQHSKLGRLGVVGDDARAVARLRSEVSRDDALDEDSDAEWGAAAAASTIDPPAAAKPMPMPKPMPKPKPPPLVSQITAPPPALEKTSALAAKAPPAAVARPAVWVNVKRPTELQAVRSTLPVFAMEQEIMEAVMESDVVLVCGPTGSGKTTQIPQFLYEAGFGGPRPHFGGIIGVTQPRRVAATAVAKRVAAELGFACRTGAAHSPVGYHIRHDAKTVGNRTVIKFMTEGVLLREAEMDPLLRRYSAIVIDEAHERSVDADLLLALVSRTALLRTTAAAAARSSGGGEASAASVVASHAAGIGPLKLIIMSATLQVDELAKNAGLFATPPPVVTIPSRTHPVTIHWSTRSAVDDYVAGAVAKVRYLHRRKQPGGILVFLAGRSDIDQALKLLRGAQKDGSGEASDEDDELDEESDDDAAANAAADAAMGPMHVLPLYGNLPAEQQQLVFAPPPEGHRLVVVATNVAETSLTIPGIRMVVDAGRVKQMELCSSSILDSSGDAPPTVGTEAEQPLPALSSAPAIEGLTEVQRLTLRWCSQAAAKQRAGRAGREAAGHVYRLYSSAAFENHFPPFSSPEMLRSPMEDVLLRLKCLGVGDISAFPFPTAPPRSRLSHGALSLYRLGALSCRNEQDLLPGERTKALVGTAGRITKLGRAMSHYPLLARFGRMMATAVAMAATSPGAKSTLDFAIAMVSIISLPPVLEWTAEQPPASVEEEVVKKADAFTEKAAALVREATSAVTVTVDEPTSPLEEWGHSAGDALSQLRVVGAFDFEGARQRGYGSQGRVRKWCKEHMVRYKTLREMQSLRLQLRRVVESASGSGSRSAASAALSVPPSAAQELLLQKIAVSGMLDRVARRVRTTEARGQAGYRACDGNILTPMFIHRRSAAHPAHRGTGRTKFADFPEWVAYLELIQAKAMPGSTEPGRVYMRGVTVVDPTWLGALALGTPLCHGVAPHDVHRGVVVSTSESCVLEVPPPRYDAELDAVRGFATAAYGDHGWLLPAQSALLPPGRLRVRWFGRCLLEGQVVPAFRTLTPLLRLSAALLCPPAAAGGVHDGGSRRVALHPRAAKLVARLVAAEPPIDSLALLTQAWARDANFLKAELKAWVHPSNAQVVDKVLAEAQHTTVITRS